jgi:hypothetical protein
MRYFALLAACIYVQCVWANEDDSDALLGNPNDVLDGKDALVETPKFKRDTRSELYNALLDDIVQSLKGEGYGRQTRHSNYEDNDRDLHREVINKRKAFWQSMGGPLPVETRLASFGSRIEPDRTGSNSPQRFKAMRYGRRR